jgi:TadE-like protein
LHRVIGKLRQALVRHVRRHPGQSLVEFTILLPVLLIMISGLIELGLLLNYYLDVIDAAREAARWGASDDPFIDDTGIFVGDIEDGVPGPPGNPFYTRVAGVAQQSIDMGSGGQISLDPASDDIVVSVFAVNGGSVEFRYPSIFGEDGWRSYFRHTSRFSTSCASTIDPPKCDADDTMRSVDALLDATAPNAGIVIVEIYYDYNMVLGLPWITAFLPDPIPLYAYSVMPNAAAEPTPTAGP